MCGKTIDKYFVTYAWVVQKLKLKGNELSIFSIILGMVASGNLMEFNGTIDYLMGMTGASRKTISNSLIKLADKNYIIKLEPNNSNGYVAVPRYKINFNTLCEKGCKGYLKKIIPDIESLIE